MSIDYFGKDIEIEEMPQGCIIFDKYGDSVIRIGSPDDALFLISSLKKMLRIQFPKVYKEKKKDITSY